MTGGVDARAFGRLEGAVEALTDATNLLAGANKELTDTIAGMSTRLSAVEDKFRAGKWAVFGALVGAGMAGYGAKDLVAAILRKFGGP